MSTKPQEDIPSDDEPLVMVSPASFDSVECPAYRSPDWVWRAAVSLAEGTLIEWQLGSPLVQKLADEIMLHGSDPRKWRSYGPNDNRQFIPRAASIYFGPDTKRRQLNSLIVAGMPPDEIAARFNTLLEVVMVYGLVFYDIEAGRFWADLQAGTGRWAGDVDAPITERRRRSRRR